MDHFSPIGFSIDSEDDLVSLIQQIISEVDDIPVKKGRYLRWSGESGAELWVQADRRNDIIGMAPHFAGSSRIRVGLSAQIRRPIDNALEGVFHAWADPSEENIESGAYPFLFEVPDIALIKDTIKLPGLATVQVTGFAEELKVYSSAEAFADSQDGESKLASRSFIPIGLFAANDGDVKQAEAKAYINGHVMETEEKINDLSGNSFVWALVETFGGVYDIVIPPSLVSEPLAEGFVVSGSFWLSGRVIDFERKQPGFFARIFGR